MTTFAFNNSNTLDGTSYGVSRNVAGSQPIKPSKDAQPAAAVGVLQTRTGNDVGVLRFIAADPNWSVGQRLDVYWATGSSGTRRGMKVSSKSGAGPWDYTVGTAGGDKGLGDNFPTALDPIQVAAPTMMDFMFTGNNLIAFCAVTPEVKGIIVVADVADAELFSFVSKLGAGAYSWDNQSGVVNPFAGVTANRVYFSHGDTATSHPVRAAAME